ncbi:MAG: hypothetical protein J6I53_10890 [Treponema sp.]|nr:hypothetical protein [Treponema sp.]
MTAGENFNEVLRQHIIECVQTIDDRQALLRIASYVERTLEVLAEKEDDTPCE